MSSNAQGFFLLRHGVIQRRSQPSKEFRMDTRIYTRIYTRKSEKLYKNGIGPFNTEHTP